LRNFKREGILQKYNNIPIFIPELACPHQCVFCDQEKISNTLKIPKPEDISGKVSEYLQTIPNENYIHIAFFGGSFTGIKLIQQEAYLKEAYKFIKSGQVKGIRLSTRPDYINITILQLLKKYGVETIELGVQSTNDTVLKKSGRGHTLKEIIYASNLINGFGFKLGLQMMIGLPGDTRKTAVQTAEDIVSLGAENSRIYPTLVIKGTALATLYAEGKYKPLELDEAVKISKEVFRILDENNVKIIRTGLHASEELTSEKSLIAGPYHPSFKELVLSDIWKDILEEKLNNIECDELILEVDPKQINYAIGYEASNKKRLLNRFKTVKFKANPSLTKYELRIGSH
jgi:histone acetyltransferase (RNA polymerase elongator complex component)